MVNESELCTKYVRREMNRPRFTQVVRCTFETHINNMVLFERYYLMVIIDFDGNHKIKHTLTHKRGRASAKAKAKAIERKTNRNILNHIHICDILCINFW